MTTPQWGICMAAILVVEMVVVCSANVLGGDLVPTADSGVGYVAAVLEYEPYDTWTEREKGYGVLKRNALVIAEFAAEAKRQRADLLVAPEYGVQSLDMHYPILEDYITYTQFVPDPAERITPCLFNSSGHDNVVAMQILSCAARDNQIYLVIDLAEASPCLDTEAGVAPKNCSGAGFIFYNSQVVFDRDGTVIARYRKRHLFLEDAFTPGDEDHATAVFVTDFDVAFTLQICFDIMYEDPGFSNVEKYGIKDVAYSTAWVDELPFDLANSNQNGWSLGKGVNILASGYHRPDAYKMGSGIFKGYSGDPPHYIYNKDSGNVLLVSNVSTVSAKSLNLIFKEEKTADVINTDNTKEGYVHFSSTFNAHNRTHLTLYQDLTNYTKVLVTPDGVGTVSACNSNFCCQLSYKYSGNQTYYLMSFSGSRPVGSGAYFLGTQQCAIVWCQTSDLTTCARTDGNSVANDIFEEFTISSPDFQADSVFPVGNHRDYALISTSLLTFAGNGSTYTIASNKPINNILAVALYGRWYNQDHE